MRSLLAETPRQCWNNVETLAQVEFFAGSVVTVVEVRTVPGELNKSLNNEPDAGDQPLGRSRTLKLTASVFAMIAALAEPLSKNAPMPPATEASKTTRTTT